MSARPSSALGFAETVSSVAELLLGAAQRHPSSGIYFAAADASRDAQFLSYPAMLDKVSNMTVFGSAGLQAFFSKHEWRALLERWGEFATLFKQIEVAGDHHTVMSPKYVASFQAALRAEISTALAETQ